MKLLPDNEETAQHEEGVLLTDSGLALEIVKELYPDMQPKASRPRRVCGLLRHREVVVNVSTLIGLVSAIAATGIGGFCEPERPPQRFEGGRRKARRLARKLRQGVAAAGRRDGLVLSIERLDNGWAKEGDDVRGLTGGQVRRHWPVYSA